MQDKNFEYYVIQPAISLSDYVESLWMVYNNTQNDKPIVVLPDGRIDLMITKSLNAPYRIALFGLGTKPEQTNYKSQYLYFCNKFQTNRRRICTKNKIE